MTPAAAAPVRPHPATPADLLVDKGAAALAAKDYAAASTALQDALRLYAAPHALYYLGALAAAEQRSVEAHDLARRFLADPGIEPTDPLRADAQRLADQLERGALPEVGDVSVSGPRGAILHLDGRIAGALPLPLLLSTGPHRVGLNQGRWRAETEVKVQTARLAELRFKAGSDAVVVTRPRTVLLLDDFQPGAGASAEPLTQALSTSVRRELLALLPRATALAYAKDLTGCLTPRGADTPAARAALADCQQRLGQRFGAAYVLTARAVREAAAPGPSAWRLELSLLDVEIGEHAGERAPACARCTLDQAAGALGEACSSLLAEAVTRPRGTLELASTPPGAEVLFDGRPVGKTPYQRALWAGSYPIELRARGYAPYSETVEVRADRPAQLQATLVPLAAATAPAATTDAAPPPRRPRWRIGVGIAAIAAGVVIGGFGVSALAQRGCVAETGADMRCARDYDTTGIGAGLVGTGAALSVAGIVLLALPPKR